jgi:putative phage-type endonuclease
VSRAYDEFMSRLEEDEMIKMLNRLPEAEAEAYPTREEWLAARQRSVGASDAPILFGLSPYTTPLGLYLQKVGEPEPERTESEAQRWGTLLEGVVREEYARVADRPVLHDGPYRIHRSTTYPFLTATLDGILPDPEKGPGILEIKTAHRASETDEVAPSYQVQIQQQLLVTGCGWGEIVVLYGGQRMVRYPVTAHASFQRILLNEAARFWHLVTTRTPPPIDASQASADLLKALYPRAHPGPPIVLPQEALAWDLEFTEAQKQIKEAEQRRDLAKHRLQQQLADGEVGHLPDGSARYSWVNEDRPEHTVKAKTIRVFRRHANKENGA